MNSLLPRRRFVQLGATWAASTVLGRGAPTPRHAPLPDFVGVNVASFVRQNRSTDPAQHIDPYDVPQVMRDELDLRIIDLVTPMLDTREPAALEKFRRRAEQAGCVITNLKVNLPALRFDSEDPATRRYGLDEYKRWIDAGAILGVRWLRPFPAAKPPRWETLVAGYEELADYAAPKGITLLVENYQWLDREPATIPRLLKALSGRVGAQPDTLNWVDNPTRLAGLAQTFPHALSCDFKVRELGPNHEHPTYDLRACFEIGRQAGFRGPWCIEHIVPEKTTQLKNLKWIAGQLRAWTAQARLG